MPFNTPILLIVFNRPASAQRVFSAIKEAKPAKLYVAADGARAGKNEESVCAETRAIVEQVDWPCEVKTLFRDENVGCGRGPKEAMDWLFEHEERGIILEDDCLPDPSFFPFCEELLERYAEDNRIMHIAGSYFLNEWRSNNDYSYHFSQLGPVWGWATWRRAWQYYDFNLSLLPQVKEKGYFDRFFLSTKERDYRLKIFQETYDSNHGIDWWDYQWDFARFTQGGLSVVPNINLISNIGFGDDATHTFNADHKSANLTTKSVEFPLKHPPFVMRDYEADRRKMVRFFSKPPLWFRVKRRIMNFL